MYIFNPSRTKAKKPRLQHIDTIKIELETPCEDHEALYAAFEKGYMDLQKSNPDLEDLDEITLKAALLMRWADLANTKGVIDKGALYLHMYLDRRSKAANPSDIVKRGRMVTFTEEVHDYFDWLKAEGESFSEVTEKAVLGVIKKDTKYKGALKKKNK